MCGVILGSGKSLLQSSAAAELRGENGFLKFCPYRGSVERSVQKWVTEKGQELQVRERMATRGQTGAWWETALTFSWRDAQCHSVCKSSVHSLLNLLLYNCHHCMRVHVHMCMYVNAYAHLSVRTWRSKMDVECLPQSFSSYSLGRVSCWTHPSLANFSLVCLASQLGSRTSDPWVPRLGWLVAISPTY